MKEKKFKNRRVELDDGTVVTVDGKITVDWDQGSDDEYVTEIKVTEYHGDITKKDEVLNHLQMMFA